MTLTKGDLQDIRTIIRDEVKDVVREEVREIVRTEVRDEVQSVIRTEVIPRLDRIEGRVEALENDVKDIYHMMTELQQGDKKFSKLTLEKKLLKLHAELLATAKQAGVSLPR